MKILADGADARSKLSHKSEKPILTGLFPWEHSVFPTCTIAVVDFVVSVYVHIFCTRCICLIIVSIGVMMMRLPLGNHRAQNTKTATDLLNSKLEDKC